MIEEIVLYLIAFFIFAVLQALAINGIHESMRGSCLDDIQRGRICKGNILYPFKRKLEEYISDYWMNPLGNCVRCMSSLYGGITFWGTVIPIFGFHWIEVWIFVLDVFILVSLNYWIYKKL